MPEFAEWRPISTVDIVLLTIHQGQLKVLLHRRPNEPFAGHLALPGGYVRPEEDASTEAAAARILRDKTGLDHFATEQLRTYSGPARDPRGWSISVVYLAMLPEEAIPEQLLNEHVTLLPLRQLVSDARPLAFDHALIVKDALSRVEARAVYSTIGTHFLPAEFKLPDLRMVLEAITGEEFNDSAFRRKIASLTDVFEETGRKTPAERSKRPAALWRVKPGARDFERTLSTQRD